MDARPGDVTRGEFRRQRRDEHHRPPAVELVPRPLLSERGAKVVAHRHGNTSAAHHTPGVVPRTGGRATFSAISWRTSRRVRMRPNGRRSDGPAAAGAEEDRGHAATDKRQAT